MIFPCELLALRRATRGKAGHLSSLLEQGHKVSSPYVMDTHLLEQGDLPLGCLRPFDLLSTNLTLGATISIESNEAWRP